MTALDLLRQMWKGATLVAWWNAWPTDREHPYWTATLTDLQGKATPIDDSAMLQAILDAKYVRRPGGRRQYHDQRVEWSLTDKGLAKLGLPTKAEMKQVVVIGADIRGKRRKSA